MDHFKINESEQSEKTSSKKVFSEAFVDKLNDDFGDDHEIHDIPSAIIEEFKDESIEDHNIESVFVDKLSDTSNLDIILGLFSAEFLESIHHCGFDLSDKEIAESVKRASDFFHLNSPKDIREGWTTGVICGMNNSNKDDVLIFNREQMKDMGITDQEGFDLVMTHEGGHRALQSMEGRYTQHQEELCCDFLTGVRAGLNGMDEDKLILALEDTVESDSHPDGLLRAEVIKSGAQYSKEFFAINNEAPSFEKCLERFDKKLNELFVNASYIPAHINLKEELQNNVSFKGLFINDKSWHLTEAQLAKEQADWHRKEADKAMKNGDVSSARDHASKAKEYDKKYNEHIQDAEKCTK